LPTPDPEAAADELERSASEHGLRGAMIHGLTGDSFHDEKRFWPIFARAEQLDLPIYIHPGLVHPAVNQAYYMPYAQEYTTLPQAALGFTCEMMTAAVRLVLSGVFDAHPNLKIILGHMGEGLPFLLERIDESLSRNTKGVRGFRDIFCRNFHITTSANFSTPALLCAMMEMGVDRILYAVDWPFIGNEEGRRWIDGAPISAEDRAKILHGNAKRLLKL
jgi:2,3-dihydroxybenzoate decarboxylase